MLKFDAETTRLLEVAYQGADITRRRQASFDALNPKPGDQLVDIGCGNGLLSLELARAVGDKGKIFGIDPSEDMRNAGAERCLEFPNVIFQHGFADNIPLDDGSMDGAVSLQVFEYLDDLPGAAKEACRILKPGGRLVIGDMNFETLSWYSDDPARMAKMKASWDKHLVELNAPALLPNILRNEGLAVDEVKPVTFSDTDLKPDGLANMMIHLMVPYAVDNGHVTSQEAQVWAQEQKTLAEDGRFFFSLTHFVITARKLGST